MAASDPQKPVEPGLKRSLGLPLLILYGLGVTIGAGIYVLIGVTVGRAGIYAPTAFLLAAIIMVFSAASFAEFSGRYPVSAGEAAYVGAAFQSTTLSRLVGLVVIGIAAISSATISLGAVGYLGEFVAVPAPLLIITVIVLMGAIAAVGILESVVFAGLLTLVEVGGLIAIIWGGFAHHPDLLSALPEVIPTSLDGHVWSGIFGAGILAFFAFIGFEDMVNVAEEAKNPRKNLPLAIFITLALVTVIYFLVVSVAVLNVPLAELAQSAAPLSLVFSSITDLPPQAVSFIAIVATLNGVMIQIIMASRVIYGLAEKDELPKALAHINPKTRTPVVATTWITGAVLVLALLFPLEALAELTSRLTLLIFASVNLSLVRLKWTHRADAHAAFRVPIYVPAIGFVLSALALLPSF